MLCDDCKKNPACMHITKIVNNQKIEKHLCNECARKTGEMNIAGLAFDNSFSVQDFLKGMFSQVFVEEAQPAAETACPNCGMTYNEFSRGGKIGCSTCYTTFENRLEPLVRRIHGASAHIGKVPRRFGGFLEAKLRIKRLKQDLERQVACEEYEKAAKIRDEIRELEKEMLEQQALHLTGQKE
jgi:protein arginine kinase activator